MIHRTEHIDALALLHGMQHFDADNPEHLQQLHDVSIQAIRINNGVLPDIAPLEKHPYLRPLQASNISGLMIGTFPPISYLCDTFNIPRLTNKNRQAIKQPDMPYFHGNNNWLWEYAPVGLEQIIEADRADQPAMVEAALNDSSVAYTDIIKYCQRLVCEKYTASDKALCNIAINDSVYQYIFDNRDLNRLYFTNSSVFGGSNHLFDKHGDYKLSERDAFGLFLKGASDNGYAIEYSLPNETAWINIDEGTRAAGERREINKTLLNKVYMQIRLVKDENYRELDICFGPSPAVVEGARKPKGNKCVQRYSIVHNISVDDSPAALLTTVLQAFFDNNMETLIPYNV